jgi:hypothetical protein
MIHWCAVLLAGMAALAADTPILSNRDSAEAFWMTDYAAAKLAAQQTNKPLLVVFR